MTNSVIQNLCWLDNKLGYRYGIFLWLSFWVPSLVVMLVDDTKGPGRDFLGFTTAFSPLSLLYYCYHFTILKRPASTASVVIPVECFARWSLIAYYGVHDITGDNPVGVMNWVLVVAVSMFGFLGLIKQVYIGFHPKDYAEYEEEQNPHII